MLRIYHAVDGGDSRLSKGAGNLQDGCPATAYGPAPPSGRPNHLKNGGCQDEPQQAVGREDQRVLRSYREGTRVAFELMRNVVYSLPMA